MPGLSRLPDRIPFSRQLLSKQLIRLMSKLMRFRHVNFTMQDHAGLMRPNGEAGRLSHGFVSMAAPSQCVPYSPVAHVTR